MSDRVRGSQLPAGVHRCKFEGVEPDRFVDGSDGYRWAFVSVDDLEKEIGTRTSNKPSLSNSYGSLYASMLGRDLKRGESVDPSMFVGRLFMVTVEEAPGFDGGSFSKLVSVEPVK